MAVVTIGQDERTRFTRTTPPGGDAGGPALAAAILALSPAGYWKLDDTSGSTAADASGNGRNGAYSGVTLGGIVGPDGVGYMVSAAATAQAGVVVPSNAAWAIARNGGTGMILAKPSALGTNQNEVLMATPDGTIADWRLRIFTSGTDRRPGIAATTGAGTAPSFLTNAGVYSDSDLEDAWHLYLFTYSGVSGAFPVFEIDGSAPAGATSGTGLADSALTTLRIAHERDSVGRVAGGFAHAAIFPTALDSTQRSTLIAAASSDGWI